MGWQTLWSHHMNPPSIYTSYELQVVAYDIIIERYKHLDVHHFEVEVANASNYDNICNFSMPLVPIDVQPSVEPQSKHDVEDFPSTYVDVHVGPTWHISMTQERYLQDLPNQLDLD